MGGATLILKTAGVPAPGSPPASSFLSRDGRMGLRFSHCGVADGGGPRCVGIEGVQKHHPVDTVPLLAQGRAKSARS